MIALSVMWMSSGHTSVQHLVMLHRPMPSSSFSIRVRDLESRGCISSAATRTKNRGPPKCSISSCSRRTWHTFWHPVHIFLVHFPLGASAGLEGRNFLVNAVIPGNVGDQVFDHGKRLHRLNRDGLVKGECVHASLACETRPAID